MIVSLVPLIRRTIRRGENLVMVDSPVLLNETTSRRGQHQAGVGGNVYNVQMHGNKM